MGHYFLDTQYVQATPTTNFLIGEGEDGVDGGPPATPSGSAGIIVV